MSEPLLQIEELSIRFGDNPEVLQALSLSLKKGETLGLVGESGSGKSLSALAIMGLLPPNAHWTGRISMKIDGHWQDWNALSTSKMRDIRRHQLAMVFQEPMSALNPVIHCGLQVMEGLPKDKAAVLEVFRKVQLPDPERIFMAFPHELSGGQRQRVVIAMALLRNAPLLICDEPTTALDATVQKEILELLKQLQLEYGMALLFISHDLGVIRHLTDRLLVLKSGQTIETGETERVFNHPTQNYTRSLIHSRPAQHGRVHRLPEPSELAQQQWVAQKAQAKAEKVEVLRADALVFHYPGSAKQVLHGVDFALYKGRTLGLVGESGSGKSTIGKLVCGLMKPSSGTLSLAQRPLVWNKADRQRIQMVFQDPYASLNPRLTVGDAIAEPLIYHHRCSRKEAQFKAREWLERIGLSADYFQRYPHAFSGGQRQRIVMARALVLQPEILVCDESVAALDVRVQARILNLLKDLQDEYGFACLFISHDMAVVRFISDEVGVLENGRLVEYGSVEQVLDHPHHPYTQKLLQAVYE